MFYAITFTPADVSISPWHYHYRHNCIFRPPRDVALLQKPLAQRSTCETRRGGCESGENVMLLLSAAPSCTLMKTRWLTVYLHTPKTDSNRACPDQSQHYTKLTMTCFTVIHSYTRERCRNEDLRRVHVFTSDGHMVAPVPLPTAP